MKPVSLLLGLHSHQPVDNFDSVVHGAIENCYLPFFKTLVDYKEFKVSVHFSGWLLEFIRTNNEELFSILQELSASNTIEFLTGGYYEPVLCAIGSKDRKKQIKKLSKYITKYFNQEPKGLWLTERVWESSIISDLVSCGVEYVTVDDYHFIQSGVAKEDLYGYYHTENNGDLLKLFPINETLRYILPFKPMKDVKEYLGTLTDKNHSKAAVIFDDGEKFGMWPGTKEWVYERGWLEEFFKEILESDYVQPKLYSDYIAENKPEGFVYLKENSYMEMGEWSLDPKDAALFKEGKSIGGRYSKFLKGGIWKNFLTKYEESARIHKRVLELSKKDLPSKTYRDALMRAQCNDVLWHGVFGGLYLPNLRDNAYKYIYMCDDMRTLSDAYELIDINQDGYLEGKLSTQEVVAIFDSKSGGQLTEFGIKDILFNLQNTLTRRSEAYHENLIVKDDFDGTNTVVVTNEGIDTIHTDEHYITHQQKEHLYFDWYTKNSFIDHVSDESFTLENFRKTAFKEHGDFVNQPFEITQDEKKIFLQREGGIYLEEGVSHASLIKSFSLANASLDFHIDLRSERENQLSYICELNFHFPDYEEVTINNRSSKEPLEFEGCSKLEIYDSFLKKRVIFECDREFELYSFPLYTVSQSEVGVDLTLQNLSIALKFPLVKEIEINGSLRVE